MSSSPQPSPTQDDQRRGLPLRRLLVGLTLLTVAAAVEKVVGLSAPMPSVEAPTRLSLDGYRISALQDSAPRPSRSTNLVESSGLLAGEFKQIKVKVGGYS